MYSFIHTIQDTYCLLTALSSAVILTLAFLLVIVRLPNKGNKMHAKFNQARLFLALSYFILGASGAVTCFSPAHTVAPSELLFITASVAAFQALLFTATHIVFIQPSVLNRKNLLRQVFGILAAILLFNIIYLYGSLPDLLFQALIFTVYLLQQIYYTYLFRRLHRRCVRQMERYYDEEQKSRLSWINLSFYSALTVGLLSLLSSVCGLYMYVVFIVLYTFFYTYMVVLLYNNRLITEIIPPAVSDAASEPEPAGQPADAAETCPTVTVTPADCEEQYRILQEHLTVWIAEKGYQQKDLNVDDIAHMLGVSRDFLRYYFRTYVHSDFRTWRSELRIGEAKRLMVEHPDYSFTRIAEIVGFNHRSNFFNQFQKLEGMTPSEWLEQKQPDS